MMTARMRFKYKSGLFQRYKKKEHRHQFPLLLPLSPRIASHRFVSPTIFSKTHFPFFAILDYFAPRPQRRKLRIPCPCPTLCLSMHCSIVQSPTPDEDDDDERLSRPL